MDHVGDVEEATGGADVGMGDDLTAVGGVGEGHGVGGKGDHGGTVLDVEVVQRSFMQLWEGKKGKMGGRGGCGEDEEDRERGSALRSGAFW